MKFVRVFALALGIAAPLWWRQRRFEREMLRAGEGLRRETDRAFEMRDRAYNEWCDELVAAIQRAFKRGAVRS